MTKRNYRYVTYMGYVWRLTIPKFNRLCKLIDAEKEFNLDELGKQLGRCEHVESLTLDSRVPK